MKKKWLEKNQVFVYLILIIFGLTGLKIRYGYKRVGNEQLPTPTSVPTAVIAVTHVPTKTEEVDYPLFKLLPYYGKGFIVEKYVAPLTLRMILNGATEAKATNDVKVWLRSQGKLGDNHKIILETDN